MRNLRASLLIIAIIAAVSANEGGTDITKNHSLIHHTWNKTDRSIIGGEEENMTIFQNVKFPGQIEEVIWCRTDNQSVFALTYESKVYVSRNHGNDWLDIEPMIKKSTGHSFGISWSMSSMTQSEADHDNIIISSDTNNNWVTTDCGETWVLLPDIKSYKSFKFHPHEQHKVLAISRKLCSTYSEEGCKEYNELHSSKDGGKTWELIAKYVYDFMWGRKAYYSFGILTDSIFIIKQESEKGNQPAEIKHFSKHKKMSIYYSENYFKTSKIVVAGGFKMWTSRCCVFAQRPTMEGSELIVSEVWDNKFHFKPVSIAGDHDYSELKVLNNMHSFYTYMYAMRKINDELQVADLLKADYSTSNYTVMHKNIVVNSQQDRAAFQELDTMMGVSIMNVYDPKFLHLAKRVAGNGNKGGVLDNINKFVTTKISFNMGGTYDLLRAPARDSLNKTYSDCDICTLHLHTHDNSLFPQVYSHKSAPGLVIGNGNVGVHISFDETEIATFMSEDGGVSWREVMKGSHVYEFGDQGGIIVMCKYNQPTTKVMFSYNYGRTWKFINFWDTPLLV